MGVLRIIPQWCCDCDHYTCHALLDYALCGKIKSDTTCKRYKEEFMHIPFELEEF